MGELRGHWGGHVNDEVPANRRGKTVCHACGGPTVHVPNPVMSHPAVLDRRHHGRRCLGCGLFIPDDADPRDVEGWGQA